MSTKYPSDHELNLRTPGGRYPGAEPASVYRDVLPHVADLHEAWQTAKDARAPITAEKRAWIAERTKRKRDLDPLVPIDRDDEERFLAEGRRLDALGRAAERRSTVALRAYDKAVVFAQIDGTVHDVAARLADQAQARAVEAWEALKAALADREKAFSGAGSPRDRTPGAKLHTFRAEVSRRQPIATRFFDEYVNQFSSDVVGDLERDRFHPLIETRSWRELEQTARREANAA
jgi:hypothetical protein